MIQTQINTYSTIPASNEFFPFNHIGEGNYITEHAITENEIILAARNLLECRFKRGMQFSNDENTRQYFLMKLAQHEHEVFCVAFLDAQNQLIADEILFTGSLTTAVVFPREVLKRALHYNAAAVVLAHNHPSGDPRPSNADKALTKVLKEALSFIEVKILDHVVVGGGPVFSFAELGIL